MRVGGDIGAICGRCGDVWHVVIAVADGGIAKVECGECGARHRYRPAAGGAGVAAGARKSAAARRTRARAKEPIVEADPTRPRRPFCTRETYRVGDRLIHSSFGEGVVQAVTGATKIRVLFEVGPKTLVHGRAGT